MSAHNSTINQNISNRRLPWEDRATRELLLLSWPIAVSMVSYALMTLVDTLFVAGLGPAALAGVGLGGTGAFLVLVFSLGLLRAVKVLVSQARGAANSRLEREAVGAGVVVSVGLGVASFFGCLALAELLPYAAESAAAGEAARSYLSLRSLGAPGLLFFVALREARYGQGDSRGPMVVGVVAHAVNIALDYLFIIVLERGVEGAALATSIAFMLEAGLIGLLQVRDGFGLREVRWQSVRRLLSVGVPTGVQFTLEMGSFALLTFLLARMGDLEVASHQIAIQVIHFTFLPALSVSETVSVLAGQAVGALRLRLVGRVARAGLSVVVVYALVCAAVLALFGAPLVRAFVDDDALTTRAAQLLLVAAVFQVFDAAQVIARGALRGVGDVRIPAVVGVITAWVSTPPLTWLLGTRFGLGALGGWIGLCVEIVVGAFILWARFGLGGWWSAARRSRTQAALS